MTSSWPSRILCPVDFSESSGAALRLAMQMAGISGASVTALHAHSWEAPAYFTPSQMEELDHQFRQSIHAADWALEEFISAECPGCDVSRRILDSAPVPAILDTARDIAADLLVLGSHGRSGLNRFLLGSVTERVLHESAVPVLTVRPPAAPLAGITRAARILCPVNDSLAARRSLQIAARIAVKLGAQLTALQVVEPRLPQAPPDVCSWLAEGQPAACRLRTLTASGDPVAETLKLAGQEGCNLLVIGARHRTLHDTTVLGSTTVRLVRLSQIPVLTVIDHPAAATR